MAIVLFSVPAAAQEVSWGVKGGVGFASISSDNPETEEFLSDQRVGVLAGVFLERTLSEDVSIVVEGLFTQKGATGTFEGTDVTASVDFVEFPILAKFPFPTMNRVRPFIYGGISPAIRTKAKLKVDGEEEDEDLDGDVEGGDIGVVVGGGVSFGAVAVEGRYNFGVFNVSKDLDEKIKTRQAAILVSVLLGGRR